MQTMCHTTHTAQRFIGTTGSKLFVSSRYKTDAASYYYTIYFSTTTRTSITVTRSTYVTYAALSSQEASLYFNSLSSELPTPASAQITIPAQPTAGAVILGSCSSTSTLSDGQVTSVCSTAIASRSGSSSSTTSGSASAGGSASQASRAGGWVPVGMMMAAGAVGVLMVVL